LICAHEAKVIWILIGLSRFKNRNTIFFL